MLAFEDLCFYSLLELYDAVYSKYAKYMQSIGNIITDKGGPRSEVDSERLVKKVSNYY